jgi:hypothetical protein
MAKGNKNHVMPRLSAYDVILLAVAALLMASRYWLLQTTEPTRGWQAEATESSDTPKFAPGLRLKSHLKIAVIATFKNYKLSC